MASSYISPLMESVPPKLYGGTGRIVSYLTEELVRQGHDVTLFASGDLQTSAELVPCSPRALRLARVHDPMPYNILQLNYVLKCADEFDILHFHNDCFHFPLMRNSATIAVTTLHGRLDLPDLPLLFRSLTTCLSYRSPRISDVLSRQLGRDRAPWTTFRSVFLIAWRPRRLSSFSGEGLPGKRNERAIEIAQRAGYPLKIAAKVDKVDQAYFDDVIAPLLGAPNIEFIGEIGEDQKRNSWGKRKRFIS